MTQYTSAKEIFVLLFRLEEEGATRVDAREIGAKLVGIQGA